MGKSRLSKRREVEAAEALEVATPAKKKKKAAKKKATRKKATTARSRRAKDTPVRRRLVWVVYSSAMREEGRFLYHERKKAEEKLEQLLAKGKRRYFIQPFKEPLDSEGVPLSPEDEDVKKSVKATKAAKAKAKKAADDDDGEEAASDEAAE